MEVVRSSLSVVILAFVIGLKLASPAMAEDVIPYGSPITLEAAHKAVTAAEAEAKKQSWPVAIAVVDGKVIGVIGVSGVQATQDAQVAKAGVDALQSKE